MDESGENKMDIRRKQDGYQEKTRWRNQMKQDGGIRRNKMEESGENKMEELEENKMEESEGTRWRNQEKTRWMNREKTE